MQCRGIYYNTSLCLKNSETLCFNFKPKSGEIKHLVKCLLIKFYVCVPIAFPPVSRGSWSRGRCWATHFLRSPKTLVYGL